MAARKPLTPAQRAAATQRQALYRERQKLIRSGQPIPKAIAPKRPATYRPPRTKTSVQAKTIARVDARQSAAQRASDKKMAEFNARAARIRQLPQARNPDANIHTADDQPRSVARNAEAAKIRKNAANQRIQAVGRGLKRDFKNQDFGIELEKYLDRGERARFRELTQRIGAVSAQTLAIYFHNEGGSGEFNVALKEIMYPVDGGDAGSGLNRLEDLARFVERAEELYGESAIGKLNI